jgi:recombination protein RecR
MEFDNYPSAWLEKAVSEFNKLPGIGKRTALRLVLHLLKKEKVDIEKFGETLIALSKHIQFCETCHNISDDHICKICSNPKRDQQTLMIVESSSDVMAIESTMQYNGVYHVLGGIISPMDGVGPKDLNIEDLSVRVLNQNIKEIIMALPTTMEGDTTAFFIYRKISHTNIKITTIARGIAIGDELQYADEITLGRSIVNRINYALQGNINN